MSQSAEGATELNRFSVRARELLLRDGWTVDNERPEPDGLVWLGSFIKPTATDFVATVEFILERGPMEYRVPGPDRLLAVIGGEFGVRHRPPPNGFTSLE